MWWLFPPWQAGTARDLNREGSMALSEISTSDVSSLSRGNTLSYLDWDLPLHEGAPRQPALWPELGWNQDDACSIRLIQACSGLYLFTCIKATIHITARSIVRTYMCIGSQGSFCVCTKPMTEDVTLLGAYTKWSQWNTTGLRFSLWSFSSDIKLKKK